jgi:hypothetical protein
MGIIPLGLCGTYKIVKMTLVSSEISNMAGEGGLLCQVFIVFISYMVCAAVTLCYISKMPHLASLEGISSLFTSVPDTAAV